MEIQILRALTDNYIYILKKGKTTAVVDPSEAQPVLENVSGLDYVLNTHHHYDHVGGNLILKQKFGAKIIGFQGDESRIPGFDMGVKEGQYQFGDLCFSILEIPGHTLGAIAFWFKEEECVFTGDTLFSVGCGRLFEGTPKQMWESLQKLKKLPPATRVYPGHEYTRNNILFARKIEPLNQNLQKKEKEVVSLLERQRPTIPSSMEEELACNPFLRTTERSVVDGVGAQGTEIAVFTALRKLKDQF